LKLKSAVYAPAYELNAFFEFFVSEVASRYVMTHVFDYRIEAGPNPTQK